MNRVIHFEIPAVDIEKSKSFYEQVFDWEFSQYENMDYWLITTGEDSEMGINGAMTKKVGGEVVSDIKGAEQAINAVITISVDDIDETMTKIEHAGGILATDKMTIPGIGTNLYFHDLDGNLMGAMQSEPRRQM